MTSLRARFTAWRQDRLLGKVLRNTGYIFIGNTLSTVIQSVLVARRLGVLGFGVLGTIITFASNVNRLISFRMGEMVVKYAGQYLSEGRKDRAAAIYKACLCIETGASVVAYLLLVLVAPWAATYIIKDPTTAPLISFYALALLANFATETSTGLLQVGDRFRSQALINLAQSLLTAGLIMVAYFTHGDIWLVMSAYLAGKTFHGLALAGYAFWRAGKIIEPGWWRASFKMLPPWREFWGFAFSTNLSGTVTLVTRDSEVIWVSTFISPLQAGYYKLALAVINLVVTPITPFINTTFPEIARAVAEKAWKRLRSLLKRLTFISAAWTAGTTAGLAILGTWLISFFYGQEYTPAVPILLILLIGYGAANILYWNRSLVISLGRPDYSLKVMALAGLVKLVLSFLLVPRYGALVEAALLSGYFVISVGMQARYGLARIQGQEGAA
jgi:O-antigen/teichoic acid export membrane protein